METATLAQALLTGNTKSPVSQRGYKQTATARVALSKLSSGNQELNCVAPRRSARRSPCKAPSVGATKKAGVAQAAGRRGFDNLENTDPSSAYGTTIFSVYPCKKCHALIETGVNRSGKITGLLCCTSCSFQFCFHCELARSNVYGKGQRRCPEHIHSLAPNHDEISAEPGSTKSASKGRNPSKEVLKQRKSSRRLLSPKKRALKKRTLR